MKNLLKKVELIKKTFIKKNEQQSQKRSQKIRIVKEIL